MPQRPRRQLSPQHQLLLMRRQLHQGFYQRYLYAGQLSLTPFQDQQYQLSALQQYRQDYTP